MIGYLQRLAQRANGAAPAAAVRPELPLWARKQAEPPAHASSERGDPPAVDLGQRTSAPLPKRGHPPAAEDSADIRQQPRRTSKQKLKPDRSTVRRSDRPAADLPLDSPEPARTAPSVRAAASTILRKPPVVEAPTEPPIQAKQEPETTARRRIEPIKTGAPRAASERTPVASAAPEVHQRHKAPAPKPRDEPGASAATASPGPRPLQPQRQRPVSGDMRLPIAPSEPGVPPVAARPLPNAPDPKIEQIIDRAVERKTRRLMRALEASRPAAPRLEPPRPSPPPSPRREEQPKVIVRTERVEVTRPAPPPPKTQPVREVRSARRAEAGRSGARSRSKLRFGLGQM